MGAVVVDTWGYGAAFMIAGSVGIACAFLSILLRQPKLKQETPTRPEPTRPTQPTPVDNEGSRGRLTVHVVSQSTPGKDWSCAGLCPPGVFCAAPATMSE